MEMTAVMKTVRWGASACVAALALALNCGVASAQLQKTPDTKTEAPPKKKAAPIKTKSACAGLDETACGGNATCQWVAASTTKKGKEVKAYCRTAPKAKAKPKPTAKKAATKAAEEPKKN